MIQSFYLKQAQISANGVIKMILILKLNKIICFTPLADICACFKQKLTKFGDFFQKTRHNTLYCQ